MKAKNEIILFENDNVKLEVNIQDETVWLTAEQMAELFKTTKRNVEMHIKNIYQENELEEISTWKNFFQVQKEGKRDVTRNKKIYNLDVIISVGYRVKSKEGTKFRIWANKILKDYMIKGYAINQKRLDYLEKTIKLIDIATRLDENLRSDESYNMLKVISDYTKALETIDRYDHKEIQKPKGKIDTSRKIKYEECIKIINEMPFKQTSKIFGLERDQGLESIINNIYQQFAEQEVYPSVEEKACNFLYLIVKDHIFVDGNKRIGATLFLYFLNFYGILRKDGKNVIDPTTLVAITLFVAQSNSREKDVVIDLLMNMLIGL